MTLISYTAPSGRSGTYETANGDPQRIKALTSLLCSSITSDATADEHLDNLFQASVSLSAELEEIDSCDDDHYCLAVHSIKTALVEFTTGENA